MRIWNSTKNIITSFAGQLLNMVLNFVVRTVFIYTLSKAYAGISGLFSSVLMILSLSELGIGSVITFAMYKPLAENDTEKLKTLMQFYRKAYRIIGFVFLGLGLMLMPFLPYLMKGSTDLVNVNMVYILYLLDIAMSYWFFAYKAAILNASQKQYVVSLYSYVGNTLTALARLAMLFLLRSTPELSFYCYVIVGIIGNIIKNLLIKEKVDRVFPWLLEKDVKPLEKSEKKTIFQKVYGMTVSLVCEVLNDGIDTVIISAVLGVNTVAIFSNYIMLKKYVNGFLSTIFGPMSASIGNLCAVESIEKKKQFFNTLQFSYFWIYGFCSICFWMLYNPFIAGVWLDESWILAERDVFLLCFNFLIDGIAAAVVKYRNVNALFWETRNRYLLSAVLNATLSVVLAGPVGLGVTGTLLGTTAGLVVMIGWDPMIVYRRIFQQNGLRFFPMYFGYLGLAMLTGALVHVLALPFAEYTVGNFLIKLFLCLGVPNGLWFILFRKRPEFQYLKNAASAIMQKVLHR